MAVVLKTAEEIERMRVAGRLASEVLDFITPHVRPGITTGKLNDLCHDYMVDVQHTVPAPLNYAPPGYRPFPKSICTSVNHQVCHGVPGDRLLKPGDILNIDVTVIKDGFHGDCSRMFFVGEPSIQARRLVEVTYECMWIGIRRVRPGARLGDVGAAIQQHAAVHDDGSVVAVQRKRGAATEERELYAMVTAGFRYTSWIACSNSMPSFIGRWNDLRPLIRPIPPARLLITAVRTASFRSVAPLLSPPELMRPARPM